MPKPKVSRRALLSVSDKTGLVDFAKGLVSLGFEIVSTGGTAKALKEAGILVTSVDAVTGFPEMMEGRVKTLHPAIHGGILYRRDKKDHAADARRHGILPIDIVCVSLYPFMETVRKNLPFEETIEQMDIGGPALVRAAAKNHAHVLVVVRPARYGEVLERLGSGDVPLDWRRALAAEAVRHTAAYDAAISRWLGAADAETFPAELPLAWEKATELRYGENPHQKGALYRDPLAPAGSLAWAEVLAEGKALSYCNWLDAEAAWACAVDLGEAACAIVKHAIPCGAAAKDAAEASFAAAWATDPLSAYGSVVAVNGTVDGGVAEALLAPDHFIEVLVARGFEPKALGTLCAKRKNLRILQIPQPAPRGALEVRILSGGALVQTPDAPDWERGKMMLVTRAKVPKAVDADLAFAWKLVLHVRSNAIVLAKDGAAVGIGAGQVNRVDAVRLAVARAGERAKGSVLASDAFFPFADGVNAAIEAGVAAVVQPGGSLRDPEVISAAQKADIPMLFTGTRHFRH